MGAGLISITITPVRPDLEATLRGRNWGNRGADAGGTAQGAFHCPAPLSPESKNTSRQSLGREEWPGGLVRATLLAVHNGDASR
eukprot:9480657-Pyramimonas_sp.AAC.1